MMQLARGDARKLRGLAFAAKRPRPRCGASAVAAQRIELLIGEELEEEYAPELGFEALRGKPRRWAQFLSPPRGRPTRGQ
ncbi:hypothetical protein [Mycolicibacterium chlorophenolicum]|uniref:hypothetical protein n=1 Tax=Mycolicibacterium chlorophenolicum TaxID=37916 RepID=UPI00103B20C1|nr:hypothetical protein [Mycolicibacterium chlorophenolicum]